VISTVAGTGDRKASAATTDRLTSAQLNHPAGVAVDSAGNLYIADASNKTSSQAISEGVISTVAGTGTEGSAATTAQPPAPS